MNNKEKEYLASQLDTIYNLLKQLEGTREKGTITHNLMYELENINMNLDIPFLD